MPSKKTLALVAMILGAATPVSAQIEQGDLAYIEAETGELGLYRRIDPPGETDGIAQFERVPPEEQQAVLDAEAGRVVPVVEQSAVMRRTPASAPTEPTVVFVDTSGTTATTTTAPTVPPTDAGEQSIVERALVRTRVGATLHGGGTFGNSDDDPEGWMVGLSLRLGLQISDWFAIYYQPVGLLSGLETSPAGGDFDEAFTWWNALLLEATLFDFLSLAAGPSMDFYFGCDPGVQAQAACSDEGAFIGAHGRVAVNIGGMLFGQRGGVTISVDVHPTWFSDDTETMALLGGAGVELY